MRTDGLANRQLNQTARSVALVNTNTVSLVPGKEKLWIYHIAV